MLNICIVFSLDVIVALPSEHQYSARHAASRWHHATITLTSLTRKYRAPNTSWCMLNICMVFSLDVIVALPSKHRYSACHGGITLPSRWHHANTQIQSSEPLDVMLNICIVFWLDFMVALPSESDILRVTLHHAGITLASRGMVVKWVRIKLKICFFERSRAVDSPRYSIFSITLKTLGDRADPSSIP